MRKIISYLTIFLALVTTGCETLEERDYSPHEARPAKDLVTVTVNALLDDNFSYDGETGRRAEYMKGLPIWTEGDVAYAVYESEGTMDVCPSGSLSIDSKNPSRATISFDVPYDAILLSVEVGGNAVFGQNMTSEDEFTKGMAYFKGEVAVPDEQGHIEDVLLVNQCRYLELDLARVSFYGIGFDTEKVRITGTGLCGGTKEETINIRWINESEKNVVVISRDAEDVSVSVDFSQGEKHITDMDTLEESAGVICINDSPDETELMTVAVTATLDMESKASADLMLKDAAADLWEWKADDKVFAKVENHGYTGNILCDRVEVDADCNKASLVFDRIPAEASVLEIFMGDAAAYGMSTSAENGITRGQIYAFCALDSPAGTSVIDDVDLKHQCSYLNIPTDKLVMNGQEYAMSSISLSGKDICNDGQLMKMNLPAQSASSSLWVAVHNGASSLKVVASAENTAALVYSSDLLDGTSDVIRAWSDNPESVSHRTVLFNDGTLVINQISVHGDIDIEQHGKEVAVYPPLGPENDYVLIDHKAPYIYPDGEQIPEDETQRKYIIDDLRNIEDVEDYYEMMKWESPDTLLWLKNKKKIRSVHFGSTVRPTSMNGWFRNCTNLASVDMSGLDLSQCTGMWGTFSRCPRLTSIDVSRWDLSNVTTISQIFEYCTGLENLDVSAWQTGNIDSFSRAFERCSKLKSLDVSSWDMSSARILRYVFAECTGLTAIDVADWDVSKVENFVGAFNLCTNIETIDVSRWNTASARNSFFKLFGDCTILKELDLSGWDVSNVVEFSNMFTRCNSIRSIDLSGWDISSLQRCPEMFRQCFKLETIYAPADFDVTGFPYDVENELVQTRAMFYQCGRLKGGLGTVIPAEKLNSDLNVECSGRYFGRVDMIDGDGTHLPGVFTLKEN